MVRIPLWFAFPVLTVDLVSHYLSMLSFLIGSISNDDSNCKTKNCENNVCGDLIVLSICNESCFDDIQCGEGGTCRGQCGILGEIECGCKW